MRVFLVVIIVVSCQHYHQYDNHNNHYHKKVAMQIPRFRLDAVFGVVAVVASCFSAPFAVLAGCSGRDVYSFGALGSSILCLLVLYSTC